MLRAVWVHRQLDGSVLDGSGIQVTWHPLSWQQFRRFQNHTELPAADIYEACLVAGPPLERAPAGIVRWIALREMQSNPFSGAFEDIKRSLDRKRAEIQSSYLLSARAVIAGTFRYSFEEIDTWSAETFFERLAQAELLIKTPLEPADPKAVKPAPKGRPRPSQVPRPPR